MLSLIKVEFKKLLGNRVVILATSLLLITLIANLSFLFFEFNQYDRKFYFNTIYDVIGPTLEQDDLITINRLRQNNSDNGLFVGRLNEVSDDLKFQLGYQAQIEKIVKHSNDFISFFGDNTYHQGIVDTYSNRSIVNIANTSGWKAYFNNQLPALLIIVILCLAVSDIFAYEKESNVNKLLLTSKNGVKQTIMAKLITCFSFTIILQFIFIATNIIFTFITYGLNGSSIEVYSLIKYQFSMFDISFITMFIVNYFIMLIGVLFFTSLFLLISSLVKSSLIAIVVNGAIFSSLTIAFDFMNIRINPIQLLQPTSFYQAYDVWIINNQLITNLHLNLIVYSLLIIVISLVVVRRQRKCF